ncbi:hypothetical protein SERLA73DRAFT_75064 [Serpula lacrymans var. lacrymans S7.3]|uniref:GmrSD restriction endonucleases N-terminal domain-containing protein n=2 Tax=Serpula lacrymans var. lacrymans TaxID=341189 RepID=F8Q2F7_SERL3|nr:uncharacterized protein SERLADRAFT_416494 [Serpula lacrymans var. lacrymans S7.9]EGN97368.1 hypothetical protein SERLA73DRAFT_75064 [Serpula lacrymans var. lacrymans S7.3]EGO22961.1 hypothetical protein SERLADRAFT_416494 [Serpula lacrymans var. lacrymans S7.9]
MSSSEEFTDYEDELEETQPIRRRGGKKNGDKSGGYKIRNVLKLPRATTYTTQALYEQIINADINLEPEYQRDVVWPEAKQIGLIDSIFRNFYIPPVIFVSHQHDDGSESKTCIDGKQRLTSMYRFMDGMIPHKDPVTNEKLWYKESAESKQRGRTKLLPDKYRRLFANKQIVCIEYQDLTDSDEREIFQRVQLGMALTPAEKLQVLSTPMAAFVRSIQATYFATDSVLGEDTLNWDRSRGGDFRCIAQALYIIAKFPHQNSVGTMPQLEKWLTKPTSGPATKKAKSKKSDEDYEDEVDLSEDSAFLERIHDTFRVLSHLVDDKSLSRVFLKKEWKVSPVEFITICLLIAVHKEELSSRELADKIGEMRAHVRQEHVDIRMNGRVSKTLLDFVKGIKVGGPTQAQKRKRDADMEVDAEAGEASRKKVTIKVEPSSMSQISPFGSASLLQQTPPSLPSRPTWATLPPPPTDPRLTTSIPPPNNWQGSSPKMTPSVPPPPRPVPDRLAAIHAAKNSIMSSSPSDSVSPRPTPSAPAAMRSTTMQRTNSDSMSHGGV